jgi:hypothetical protein
VRWFLILVKRRGSTSSAVDVPIANPISKKMKTSGATRAVRAPPGSTIAPVTARPAALVARDSRPRVHRADARWRAASARPAR